MKIIVGTENEGEKDNSECDNRATEGEILRSRLMGRSAM